MSATSDVLSNTPLSSNPDIIVRASKNSSNESIQHMRLDVGVGLTESQVSNANPLPITSGFAIPTYDYLAVTYPTATTETYTFKDGGSGGSTVGVITITYTNSTKANISSVARSA